MRALLFKSRFRQREREDAIQPGLSHPQWDSRARNSLASAVSWCRASPAISSRRGFLAICHLFTCADSARALSR